MSKPSLEGINHPCPHTTDGSICDMCLGKKDNWFMAEDHNYRFSGDEIHGFMKSGVWAVKVYIFGNRLTGEIKVFNKILCDRLGTDKILEILNK